MLRTLLLGMILFSLRMAAINAAPVSIFPSSDLASEHAARKIADLIIENGEKGTVLGLATGGTMVPVYAALKKIIREESIDLSQVVTFNLDEYLDIPISHPQSYHSFMYSNLFEEFLYSENYPKGFKEENIHIPTSENCCEYESEIAMLGPIDLQLLGIGTNCHIGFAEPGTPFDSRTMIVELSESTRKDNSRFFEGNLELVPRRAVTMGIETILQAKKIILIAFGEGKAEAIAKTLNGPLSPQVPSTALQTHRNTSLILDEKAALLLKDAKVQRFTHARLLLDHRIQEGELWVAGGKIIPPQEIADVEIDLQGKIISPGFIDLQINGGFGCDFSRNPEKVSRVAKRILQYGVTAFLPTVISSSPQQYRAVLPRLQPRSFGKKGAAILGIHLEGPFFSPHHAGAHNPELVIPRFNGSLETVYGDLQSVKIVTLAPEIPGGTQLVRQLKDRGIFVSAGHSGATYDQICASINVGVGLATHLFNAMAPYHHRDPGIVGSALIDPMLPYSLIVDGLHLCSESVRLCWRCNPNGLILVSDATEALGLSDGRYKLGTLDIDVHEQQIYLTGTRVLAGSNLNLNKAVQMLRSMTHCSQAEALEAASLKPAQLINIYPTKGTLEIGADADFIVLSDELDVEATYLGGELAWDSK